MNRILLLFSFTLVFGATQAQNNVNATASDSWTGFMNVFETQANGGGYAFGSSWGVSDLKTEIDSVANTITLFPNFNTYNASDPYWSDSITNSGNKDMEASTYVEPGATFNGQDLTFKGQVVSNTLDASYSASFFIKALDPANNYADALAGAKVIALPASGEFTVSATAAELASGLVVQYGFVVRGINANPADSAALGNIQITSSTASLTENTVASFNVYPNPSNDIISLSGINAGDSWIIRDFQGRIVAEGSEVTGIDISTLDSGVYFVALNDNKYGVKFVKN